MPKKALSKRFKHRKRPRSSRIKKSDVETVSAASASGILGAIPPVTEGDESSTNDSDEQADAGKQTKLDQNNSPANLDEPPTEQNEEPSDVFLASTESSLEGSNATANKDGTQNIGTATIPQVTSTDLTCSTTSLDSETDQGQQVDKTPIKIPIQIVDWENHAALWKEIQTGPNQLLPTHWITFADATGLHVMLLSTSAVKSIQREVQVLPSGEVHIIVHSVVLPSHPCTQALREAYLSRATIDDFVKVLFQVVSELSGLDVCCGVQNPELMYVWRTCGVGKLDSNLFHEERYTETIRADSCALLVNGKHLRCPQCTKLIRSLKAKATASSDDAHPFTANIHLSEEQKTMKLKLQSREIRNAKRKIKRMEEYGSITFLCV